jgi:hypothetical protein
MPTKDGKHAYTEEEKAEIIAHVLVNVACGRFVSRIFKEDDIISNGVQLPNPETFWRWVLEDDNLPDAAPDKQGLSNKLARAREQGVEALLDEVVDISDDGSNDWMEREYESGDSKIILNGEAVQRSKLRIETRVKLAQMLKPKKYGAKLDLTNSDGKLDMAEQVRRGIQRAREEAAKEGND